MLSSRLNCDCFFITENLKIKCLSVDDLLANLDVCKKLGKRSCTLRLVDKRNHGVEIDFDCAETGEYMKFD